MENDLFLVNYILLVALLFLSFYFSGSEAAIFSLNRLERNALRKTKSQRKNMIISYLLGNQDQLLISILTGNMIVNIFASSIGSLVGDRIFGGNSEIISIVGMTVLLLLMGELTPKRIAVNHSKAFTRVTAATLYYLHRAMTPLRFLLNHISDYVLALFPHDLGAGGEDLHSLVSSTVEMGFNQGILKEREYLLFKSYLSQKRKNARSIMIPRSDLRSLPHDLTLTAGLKGISADRDYLVDSHVLLHKNDYDHLYGWVPYASLLKKAYSPEAGEIKLKHLARDLPVVPESKSLNQLMAEMKEAGQSLALVLDEYGGTAGLITFSRIIKDAMGAYYRPVDSLNVPIPGYTPLEDLRDLYDLPSSDAATAAGFFLERFGRIPVPGDISRINGLILSVEEMEKNRIKSLRLILDSSP